MAPIPETSPPQSPIVCPANEEIRAGADLGDGRITIDTSKPGHPLWIKVSYHPDWRITEGAGELYPASPAFMLLVPRTSRVVLTFDTGAGVYLWGRILSLFTIVVIILQGPVRPDASHPSPFHKAGPPAGLAERMTAAKTPTELKSRFPGPRNRHKRKILFRARSNGPCHSLGNIDEEPS